MYEQNFEERIKELGKIDLSVSLRASGRAGLGDDRQKGR